jgi:hypothetical protein
MALLNWAGYPAIFSIRYPAGYPVFDQKPYIKKAGLSGASLKTRI